MFYVLLFIVAMLYAMVGHGGASGYLALMAIWSIAPATMKATALVLNLCVSAISFVQFYRKGHFKPALFWPLALASVPMAYWGGLIQLDAALYKKLLGIFLLFPVIRFLLRHERTEHELNPAHLPGLALMGGLIGFVSGLIGIGGGIILSPILLMLHWTTQKQTAAISALFIFVNSFAGLAGMAQNGLNISSDMFLYAGTAVAGGLLGARLGAFDLRQNQLKYVLVLVLLIAIYKLFL